LQEAFRAPNFAELASNGAHEGTNRYEIGNTDLKSEVSLQGDAGIELTTEHVSLDASLFYNHINNFIFYER
jgi:iron complex outermembrane receptor protein